MNQHPGGPGQHWRTANMFFSADSWPTLPLICSSLLVMEMHTLHAASERRTFLNAESAFLQRQSSTAGVLPCRPNRSHDCPSIYNCFSDCSTWDAMLVSTSLSPFLPYSLGPSKVFLFVFVPEPPSSHLQRQCHRWFNPMNWPLQLSTCTMPGANGFPIPFRIT